MSPWFHQEIISIFQKMLMRLSNAESMDSRQYNWCVNELMPSLERFSAPTLKGHLSVSTVQDEDQQMNMKHILACHI